MVHWSVQTGDILDLSCEVLVCSANPYLTLSGGVGGALLLRYGTGLQDELNHYLATRETRKVEPGSLIKVNATGSPYRYVLHAVAVDAAYQTSSELIESLVVKACDFCGASGVKSMALTALATGYGPMSHAAFAESIQPLLLRDFGSLERVIIGARHHHEAVEISQVLSI